MPLSAQTIAKLKRTVRIKSEVLICILIGKKGQPIGHLSHHNLDEAEKFIRARGPVHDDPPDLEEEDLSERTRLFEEEHGESYPDDTYLVEEN